LLLLQLGLKKYQREKEKKEKKRKKDKMNLIGFLNGKKHNGKNQENYLHT
jgi:hypothetical protein